MRPTTDNDDQLDQGVWGTLAIEPSPGHGEGHVTRDVRSSVYEWDGTDHEPLLRFSLSFAVSAG